MIMIIGSGSNSKVNPWQLSIFDFEGFKSDIDFEDFDKPHLEKEEEVKSVSQLNFC